jgi:hypothetical protein
MAHDLIHIIVTALLCRLEQKRFVLSVHRTNSVWNGPEVWGHRSNCHHCAGWHKTKRPGLGLSHKALSRSALPQVLLNYRVVPSLLVVNGTAVLDGITFRLFPTNFDGYRFGCAGGWALQIVVTRFNLHWQPMARRQSNANQ